VNTDLPTYFTFIQMSQSALGKECKFMPTEYRFNTTVTSYIIKDAVKCLHGQKILMNNISNYK